MISAARSGTPSYGFRLKFHLPAGRTFRGVHPRRRLHFEGVKGRVYLVTLPQPKRHRFGARTKHVLLGMRFDSYEAARGCGTKLKRALCLFAAQRRIGLDAGHDQATARTSQAIKDLVAAQHSLQLRDDVHGLDVYCEQPPVRRFGTEAYGSVKHVIDDYEDSLRRFYAAQVTFTPKQRLAIDLYNLSHFENVPKTRFLTLVTVVEVLATRTKRSPAVRALLKEFLTNVRSSGLTVIEKQRLRDGLGNLKQESISGACKDFVGTYSSAEQATFFSNCYKARSDLVHDGKTSRPEATDPTRLDELVSQMLIASLSRAV